ncbi:MAG: hypothetical protein L0J77_03170 [Marinobacter sp.]|nr:hypothetical protein [Marinobacter sp.]
MAQNQTSAEAVLRPGRAADPVPSPVNTVKSAGQGSSPVQAAQHEGQADAGNHAAENSPAEGEQPGQEQNSSIDNHEENGPAQAQSRQRKLRLMLRQCDRVLLMDFDLLAMTDWPDNYSVAAARRRRDLWLFSALVAATIFLSGLTGFVPAWIAGGGFGAFVIILLLGVPVVRGIYSATPSYLDLLIKRQRMMRDARKHADHLEGSDGLIWQCARMAEFNPALKNTRFSSLLGLSEQKSLPRALSRREHIRLYLIYLLEAEKAYGRVQAAFFEGHQAAIDQGWQTVVAEPEDRT